MKKLEDLIKRADEVIELSKEAKGIISPDSYRVEKFGKLRAVALSFIESTFGREHSHYREFRDRCLDAGERSLSMAHGILIAIRDELTGGWIETTRGLITTEVFADFLEMAEHLLEEGYKDADDAKQVEYLLEGVRQFIARVRP